MVRRARWGIGLCVALVACTDDTDGLDGTLGPDAGAPDRPAVVDCDDGLPCTDDRVADDGQCVHTPRDDLCADDVCARGVCRAGAGCVAVPASDGTICADGPACRPFVCRSGACAQVEAPSGAVCTDGDPCTLEDRCESGACVPGPRAGGRLDVAARSFLVDRVEAATFVQDRLAAQIRAGGPRMRWVARHGDRAAPIGDLGFSLDGPGPLLPLGPGRWARLSAARGGAALHLEVIEDDGAYTLWSPGGAEVGSRPAEAPELVTVADEVLYFCAATSTGDAALHALDLGAPGPRGPPVALLEAGRPTDPCRPPDAGGATGHGAYWARWVSGAAGPALTILRARADGADVLISFSYAPDGVHRYGDIEAVAVDDDGFTVLAVDNPQWVYTFDAGGTGAIDTAPVNRPAGARLLAVRDRQAIFHHEGDLLVYDLTDVGRPAARRVEGDIARHEIGPARVLDADGRRLALVDGAGRLHWFAEGPDGAYARPVPVAGQAVLHDAVPFAAQTLGWSGRHVIALPTEWLLAPDVAGAPEAIARPEEALLAARSEQETLLLGRPEQDPRLACQSAPDRCRAQVSPDQSRLPFVVWTDGALELGVALNLRAGPWGVTQARGLAAWHLDPAMDGGSWVTATAFERGQLEDRTSWVAIDDAERASAQVDLHPEGMTVRIGGTQAVLLARDAAGELVERARVRGNDLQGAAWDPPYWYLFDGGVGSDARRFVVYEVGADGGARRLVEVPAGRSRWLGRLDGRLFTDDGARLTAWSAAGPDVVEAGTIELVSPGLRAVDTSAGPAIVRADGLTVLTPACR